MILSNASPNFSASGPFAIRLHQADLSPRESPDPFAICHHDELINVKNIGP